MRPVLPADRPVAQFRKVAESVHLESVRERLARIRTGRADAVDLMPGRLVADLEAVIRVLDGGERSGR